jgi:hypothetical protein
LTKGFKEENAEAAKKTSYSSVAVPASVSWQEMAVAEALGVELANELKKQGAVEILERAKKETANA